jgi:2,3,4,5-tetrahydropyridine-2-carboxylate N-succinyltransferase
MRRGKTAALQPDAAPAAIGEAVAEVIGQLDEGTLRVAEKIDGNWVTHQWLKKAVLLSFRLQENTPARRRRDALFRQGAEQVRRLRQRPFARGGFRVVPPATARRGAFIGRNVVLMPSYVNIGAYVDEGTMVDTWATVGSCAQIGKNVHLSGGVGIGGVLEPLQANPTIIEDNCFIGARSEVVEGSSSAKVRSSRWASIWASRPRSSTAKPVTVSYGRVPPGSVVVSGNLPARDGSYSLYCAVIVKKVDARTRAKTSINDLLRGD